MCSNMKTKTILFIAIAVMCFACKNNAATGESEKPKGFNGETDLLLVQFDCKTDVDDLHTIAGLVTLMSDESLSEVNYHAVAGTYGAQDGLYVPPNTLFELAFGTNWTDAHNNVAPAVEKVMAIVLPILNNSGDVWIAEAGQSDFTAALVEAIQAEMPELETEQRIHVVQHSSWNEDVTTPEKLEFVKSNTDYVKIADGNGVGNGTPGFRDPEYSNWKENLTDATLIEIWQHAIDLANQYNGVEGRYNNEAITAGGLDFSDLSEVCWILGLQDIKDTEEFFNRFGN